MRINAVILFTILSLKVIPSESQVINYRVSTTYGRFTNVNNAASIILKNNGYQSFDFGLGWSNKPSESSYIADAWNYPIFGVGMSINANEAMNLKEGIKFSNFYNLYAYTEWDYFRREKYSAGIIGKFGLAYFRDIYDRSANPDQEFIGGHVPMFSSLGPYVKWRPSPLWEVGLSSLYWHHSCGRLNIPNLGLNEYGVEVFTRYYVEPPYTGGRRYNNRHHFDKKISYNFYASGTRYFSRAQWLAESDTEHYRLRASVGASTMWKLTDVFSTGVDAELNYSSDTEHLERYDVILHGMKSDRGYNPFYFGIASANELFLGRNVSMMICLGAYLYRELGIQEDISRLYQKLGGRYYFDRFGNTFIGFNVRAFNFGRADNMDFYIGKQF